MSKTKNTKNGMHNTKTETLDSEFYIPSDAIIPPSKLKKIRSTMTNPKETALKYRVNVKPLSVNNAWKGKRYRSKKYDSFEALVKSQLPQKIELPEPPYTIHLKFGFSSAASDWDNPIKPTQDVIAKKYGFNDKLIKKGIVETEQVPKGKEYFEFELLTFK